MSESQNKDKQLRALEIERALQDQKLNFLNLELTDLREKLDNKQQWNKLVEGVYENNTKGYDVTEHLKREIDRLEKQKLQLKCQNEEFQQTIYKNRATLDEVIQENQRLDLLSNQTEQQAIQSQAESKDFQTKYNDLMSNHKALQQEFTTQQQTNNDQMNIKKDNIDKLNQTLRQLDIDHQLQISKIHQQSSLQDQNNNNLIKQQTDDIKDLEEQLTESNQKAREMKINYDTLKSSHHETQQALIVKIQSMKQLERIQLESKDIFNKELGQMKEQMSLSAKNEELMQSEKIVQAQQLTGTLALVKQLELRISQYGEQYEREINDLMDNIEQKNYTIVQMQKLHEDQSTDILQKCQEIDSWQVRFQELNDQHQIDLTTLTQDNGNLIEDNKSLQVEISSAHSEKIILVKKNEQLKQSLKESELSFNKEYISLRQIHNYLEQEIKNLYKQNDLLKVKDQKCQENELTLTIANKSKEEEQIKLILSHQTQQSIMLQQIQENEEKYKICLDQMQQMYRFQSNEKDKQWEQITNQLEQKLSESTINSNNTSQIKIKIIQEALDRAKLRESELIRLVDEERSNLKFSAEQHVLQCSGFKEQIIKLTNTCKTFEMEKHHKEIDIEQMRAKINLLNFQCEDKTKVIDEHIQNSVVQRLGGESFTSVDFAITKRSEQRQNRSNLSCNEYSQMVVESSDEGILKQNNKKTPLPKQSLVINLKDYTPKVNLSHDFQSKNKILNTRYNDKKSNN